MNSAIDINSSQDHRTERQTRQRQRQMSLAGQICLMMRLSRANLFPGRLPASFPNRPIETCWDPASRLFGGILYFGLTLNRVRGTFQVAAQYFHETSKVRKSSILIVVPSIASRRPDFQRRYQEADCAQSSTGLPSQDGANSMLWAMHSAVRRSAFASELVYFAAICTMID
jgi:hypothetical protein